MNEFEKARLHEKIKSFAIEQFSIELKDDELEKHSEAELEKIIDKMEDVVRSGESQWLLSYVEGVGIDFMKAVFTFDKYSIYCELPNVESMVREELYYEVNEWAIDGVLECLDCKKYLEDCMDFVPTKYGYIRSC